MLEGQGNGRGRIKPCSRLICSSEGDLFDTLKLIHLVLCIVNSNVTSSVMVIDRSRRGPGPR